MPSQTPPIFSDGEGYERMMGRWSRLAGQRFLDWLDPAKGLEWVDIGCGNGAFSETLFERTNAAAVDGIDPSGELLASASARLAGTKARFVKGDAQDLPYTDNSFDAAVMALVINFIPDPQRAVAEMARVLRPGGTASAYIWDIEGGGFTMEPIRQALRSFGVDAPVTAPHKARRDFMQATWENAGFDKIETTRFTVELVYPDFEDFWGASTGIPNSVAKAVKELDESQVAKLRNLLQQSLPPAEDGTIRYTAAVNAVRGSKRS